MPKRNNRRSSENKLPGSGADSQLRKMEILLNLTRQIAASEQLDDMLKIIVEMTTREIGAERASLFLNDKQTGELYSRVAQGNFQREIRILNTAGIAGHVFTTGVKTIVHDTSTDQHFDKSIDAETDFMTKSVICTPIKTVKGEIIGVIEALNKKKGRFTKKDLSLLVAMTTQAAISLQSAQEIEKMKASHQQEMQFLDIVSDIISEIDLGTLLQKVMGEVTRMLKAERSTLFLNDEKTSELWSEVGEGLNAAQIRLPNNVGIAGAVFTSGVTINIPYAYADMRFNPAFDKSTGFFTRSILCAPVVNKNGKIIGVTQSLNKRGGPFTSEDESRLKAFTAQVSIALENAKLFNDVQNMKNYSESMLESMSNGVITLNEDGIIITCNAAGLRIMGVEADEIINKPSEEYFIGEMSWVIEKIKKVIETQTPDTVMDGEMEFAGETLSVNLSFLPLISSQKEKLGSMIMIEDISSEKRMKSTMSRYMDPVIADQLMGKGEDFLGGKNTNATILFSDIRSFTTLSEELGPQGTVALLNDYFTIMVNSIQHEGGMLDKFIGDAIMAAFGVPVAHGDDEDRAVRASISMIVDLAVWNQSRIAEGKKIVDMGIGLNTDMVVSGNIGAPKRMDYTMIGDGVNLAARLESACKQYFAHILISENTCKKLKGTYRMREIDLVQVKGKTKPVGVYEVLDYHTEETFPNLMEVVNRFRDGITSYREMRWDRATEAFHEALKLHPEDGLSRMYIDRCKLMMENPPGDEWDRVWVMTSK